MSSLRARRISMSLSGLAIVSIVLTCCSGSTSPHLDPGGQLIQQNVTVAPITTANSPATVSRSSGLTAVISAATPTQSISVNNGGGACVTEQFSGGLQSGTTQYSFTFAAVPGAPANCTQTVTFTVDKIVVTFFVIVP